MKRYIVKTDGCCRSTFVTKKKHVILLRRYNWQFTNTAENGEKSTINTATNELACAYSIFTHTKKSPVWIAKTSRREKPLGWKYQQFSVMCISNDRVICLFVALFQWNFTKSSLYRHVKLHLCRARSGCSVFFASEREKWEQTCSRVAKFRNEELINFSSRRIRPTCLYKRWGISRGHWKC